jgi:tRNA dimethylallyltransferase
MNNNKNKKIICIAGATASGKSNLALRVAKEKNGEIISVDSRQIYKNIPIFSGISGGERENHLVCFLDEWETFSAGEFVRLANKKIEEVLKKGKTPIFVGGTSFYFKSLLYENFLPKVEVDKKFRKKMVGKSAEELMKILKKSAPERAKNIDSKNIPRIIRSIEVVNSLGSFPENEEKIRSDLEIDFFWVSLESDVQKKNIEINFKKRMENGFLKEAENLRNILEKNSEKSYTITQIFPLIKNIYSFLFKKKRQKKIEKIFLDLGLAYKNIIDLWEGKINEERFVELGILEEQKYAKRQNTYLKKFFEQLPKSDRLRKETILK